MTVYRLSLLTFLIGIASVLAQGPVVKGLPSKLPDAVSNAPQVPTPPNFQPVIPDRGDSPNPLAVEFTGPNSAMVNEEINCKITVTNRGSMPIVRAGLKLFASLGMKLPDIGKPVRPAFSLDPGASISVPIKARPTQSGTQGIKVEVTADGNWKKSAELLVEVRKPQLKVELVGPKAIKPNTPGDYTLTITNTGDLQTPDTAVFLEIPLGWEFVSSYPAATWVPEKRYAYWTLGDFAAGQNFRYQMRIKSSKPGTGEIRASAKDAGSAWGESYWFTKADPNAPDPPPTPAQLPTTVPAGGSPSTGASSSSRRGPGTQPPTNISSAKKSLRR